MNGYVFPDEFVRPEIKEKPEYGLQYIQAAWASNDRFGAGRFADQEQIQSLVEIAQGNMSTEPLRRQFGVINDPTSRYDDGPNSLVHIDPQVLNLASKYVNRAVAKINMRQFDVGLEAIDQVSGDQKKDYQASIKAFYRLKSFYQEMGVPYQAVSEGLDIATLPEFPDELLYDIEVNPKLAKEIAGEMILQEVKEADRYAHKMMLNIWNLVVKGWAHVEIFNDHNGIPRMKVIQHEYWGGSYVEDDDFEEQEYAFYIEPITVNQFIKEAHPYYDEQELRHIAYKYSNQNQEFTGIESTNFFDHLSYIPVVRFYFLSEDNRSYVSRNNQHGSKILMEKDFNYSPPSDVLARFEEGGDSRVIKNTYTSCYGGTWVYNSDIVYNYGRKNTPRTNLVNTSLPIKTFTTNYKKGRAVSFTAQIIQPLDMINVAWNKIKETLAKGWMGIRNVDLSAIEAAALGKGGNVWTPREVIEYLNMSNTAVGRRNSGNPYGQSNGDIVTITAAGVQLADYFNTLTVAVNMMEQMTGTSIVESANVPDRLPAKAVGASQNAAEIDMQYLYEAYSNMNFRTTHNLLLACQEAVKDPKAIQYFLPGIGRVNIDQLKEMAYCEYAIRLSKKPTQEEWLEFYQDVRIALEAGMKGLPGGIRLSDSIFLREIDNLKQARQMLLIREAKYQREMTQQKQLDNQMAMEANQRAAQDKFQYEQAMMMEQGKIDMKIEEMKGQMKLQAQEQNSRLNNMTQQISDEMKRVIKDIEGKYSTLKEGMKSQATKYESDQKLRGTIYAAEKKVEQAEKTPAPKK